MNENLNKKQKSIQNALITKEKQLEIIQLDLLRDI